MSTIDSMGIIVAPAIDDIAIRNLVTAFCTRVRRDHLLSPVFERTIGKTDAEWTAHLAHLRDFWSSMMAAGCHYRGKPIPAHPRLPDLEPVMFERWLWLFKGTCTDLFEPAMAFAFQDRVNRIAETLRRAAGTAIPYSRSASVHQEISPLAG
jgi:hemoglobin